MKKSICILNVSYLKQFCIPARTSYFKKFYCFWNFNFLPKIWFFFFKKTACQNLDPKLCKLLYFFLRHHLWQIFTTAANFLSRNTRFLTLGQVFNQSLWKLVQLESTCFKTLKLLKISERCKTGLFMTSRSKVPQNIFQVIYYNQTTIETSTLPIICTFKMPNLILWVIFQNFEWFVSFAVSLTPNWVKRAQSCTSRMRETSKSISDGTLKWGVFLRSVFKLLQFWLLWWRY